MIKNKKGFGIAESIILCGFLIFLIIPAFSVIAEKVYLKYSIHKINELADASIMSSVFSIDRPAFSDGELIIKNKRKLKKKVYKILSMNTFENMKIIEFDMTVHEAGEYCSSGGTSGYDFVHLMMKVLLERYGSKDPVEFWIHRDLELPYDR